MIIRVEKRSHPYVVIDKTALDDPALSFRAKGIHAYLLSRPDNWNPNPQQLAKAAREGRDAVKVALRELSEAGYFVRERKRREDGSFYWQGTVYEIPVNAPTSNGKSVTGNPVTDNPPLISNVVTSNEGMSIEEPSPSAPPKGYLNELTEIYADLQGVRPRGDAWKPIQQGFRVMVKEENYTPEQVAQCMRGLAKWGVPWTIATVRRWIAHAAADKLPSSFSGEKPQRARGRDASEYQQIVKGGSVGCQGG